MEDTARSHQAICWPVRRAARLIGAQHLSRRRSARVTPFARLASRAFRCGTVVLVCLCLEFGVMRGVWAGTTRVLAVAVPASQLVVCISPATTLSAHPCPTPGPSGPSTTLLGACPGDRLEACATLSVFANTWAFYGVVALGFLGALWVLWTAIQAVSPAGSIRQHEGLALLGRNFLIACFLFLVAWDLQATFAQVETLLLASEQDPKALFVFLAGVTLTLLVQVGSGLVLLRMFLSILSGVFAVAGGNPRVLGLTVRRLGLLVGLLVVIAAAPWAFAQAAHILTAGFL